MSVTSTRGSRQRLAPVPILLLLTAFSVEALEMRTWWRLNSRCRPTYSGHPTTATVTRCQATLRKTPASTTNPQNDYESPSGIKDKDDIPPSHPLQSIRNPWTGRNIQQTPFSASLLSRSKCSSSSSVWQTHFLSPGGWLAHEGRAYPLFSQSVDQNATLLLHNPPVKNDKNNSSSSSSSSSSSWYELTPSLERVATNTESSCPIPIQDLPRIDELMWVSKPVNLLTLPGKSEPDALSNQVLQYLEDDIMNHPAVSTQLTQPTYDTDHDHHMSSSNKQQSAKTTTIKKKNNKKKKDKKAWIPRPCHRLDKDTSGIIVIGLTRDAYKGVSLQFEQRHTRKRYVALVKGLIREDTGTINLPIGSLPKVDKDGHSYKTWSTSPQTENPREAITHWEVSHRYTNGTTVAVTNRSKQDGNSGRSLLEFSDYTRVVLHPKTGRGHQLRLHMAEGLGHEILGDVLHGRGVNMNGHDEDARSSTTTANDIAPRLCLHAEYLELWARDDNNVVCKVKCWNVPPF